MSAPQPRGRAGEGEPAQQRELGKLERPEQQPPLEPELPAAQDLLAREVALGQPLAPRRAPEALTPRA